MEANWTDPILFFIYSVAKPIASALILIFMRYVKRVPGYIVALVVGTGLVMLLKLPVETRTRVGANIDVLQESKQPIAHGCTASHPAIEVEAVDDLFRPPSGIQCMDRVAVSDPDEHICER